MSTGQVPVRGYMTLIDAQDVVPYRTPTQTNARIVHRLSTYRLLPLDGTSHKSRAHSVYAVKAAVFTATAVTTSHLTHLTRPTGPGMAARYD
jgi:hypothetical protein